MGLGKRMPARSVYVKGGEYAGAEGAKERKCLGVEKARYKEKGKKGKCLNMLRAVFLKHHQKEVHTRTHALTHARSILL